MAEEKSFEEQQNAWLESKGKPAEPVSKKDERFIDTQKKKNLRRARKAFRSDLQPAFKESYCEMLVEHMRQGFSFQCFPAEIGCGLSTIVHWVDKHPTFAIAYEQGEALGRKYWETLGQAGARGNIKINYQFWHVFVRHRFGMADKDKTIAIVDQSSKEKRETLIVDLGEANASNKQRESGVEIVLEPGTDYSAGGTERDSGGTEVQPVRAPTDTKVK